MTIDFKGADYPKGVILHAVFFGLVACVDASVYASVF